MVCVRGLFLCCVAAAALTAAGCVAGASSSQDPSVEAVDAPGSGAADKPAPEVYWVRLATTKGDVDIEVHRSWSPHGADRFHELVRNGFYTGCRFFRVLPGFVAQTGIAGDASVDAKWRDKNIPDDHLKSEDANRQSNKRGFVTFAKTGQPNSRSTQFFINTADNSRLDGMGFTPFGKVLSGMAAVDGFYAGYREEPMQPRIEAQGNAYLDEQFPKLDSIKTATLLPKKPEAQPPAG